MRFWCEGTRILAGQNAELTFIQVSTKPKTDESIDSSLQYGLNIVDEDYTVMSIFSYPFSV